MVRQTGKKRLYKIYEIMNEYITRFLERNGFIKQEDSIYKNERCTVTIDEDYYVIEYYEKAFLEYLTFYTDSLSLPNLLGQLLWMELIDRDFSK